MQRYIHGFYCRNEIDLQIIKKDSNRKILRTLHEAYPSPIDAEEISIKTGLPIKTVYSKIDELSREHYIVVIPSRILLKPRGRPPEHLIGPIPTTPTAQRNRYLVLIEEVTSLFDPYEEKGKGETPLPLGHVEYSGQFLQLFDEMVEKEELEATEVFIFPSEPSSFQ